MGSVIQFNDDFKKTEQVFDFKKKNSKLLNEKSDNYDYLLKNKEKNLKRLSKLMETKDDDVTFSNTPIHLIILKTITTVEKFITEVSNNGTEAKMSYSDKFYIGIALGFVTVLLLLFKL